jgi:hypothetical protein
MDGNGATGKILPFRRYNDDTEDTLHISTSREEDDVLIQIHRSSMFSTAYSVAEYLAWLHLVPFLVASDARAFVS